MGMNIFTPATVEADVALWDKIMEGNLRATFPGLPPGLSADENGGGGIINISSTAGLRAAPGMGIYGIAKAGMNMLTRVLAKELAPYGIRVNAVAPGMVETEFSQALLGQRGYFQGIVKRHPPGPDCQD